MKFCLDDFSLKDEPRSGRRSDVSDEGLRSIIRANSGLTSTEMGFKLGIYQTTALDCIKGIGFVSKPSVWGKHESSKKFNGQNFDMLFKSCSSQNGIVFGTHGYWR
ncbi:hypothetical protein TNCV_447281 [Trichonephila clavipes]|nr:hypothetical protein TNCV_447281 [Trichonephila clavipes]